MVLREFQDGGRIKKNLEQSDGSLKGDLSTDTTFAPTLKSRRTVPLRQSGHPGKIHEKKGGCPKTVTNVNFEGADFSCLEYRGLSVTVAICHWVEMLQK
jgi:hypothetical protein